jgi:uncharacterized protein YjbI with pentapeptide repeats
VAQEPRTAQERALELLRATLAISSWLPAAEAKRLVWVIRCAIALGLLVLIASVVDKTLWDWLGLLIVPVVLAIGGYLFNSSQNRATQAAAERRAQDEALQAYLDQVGKLLLDKARPLRETQARDEARTLARARTIAVLRSLDANHNGIVLSFLQESGLINQESPVISLQAADLSQVHLERMTLRNVSLSDAKLRQANFEEAVLWSLSLHEVDLTEANLKKVVIYGNVDLSGSTLKRADLRGGELISLGIEEMEINLGSADLEGADLREAVLGGDYGFRDLRLYSTTIASGAVSHPSSFKGANFDNAILKGANLHRAQLTAEQLAQCRLLEGATMPNGQKYEEWLKTPDGQDWLRKYKCELGAYKKKIGQYESWIQTTEGQMWRKACGDGGNSDSS